MIGCVKVVVYWLYDLVIGFVFEMIDVVVVLCEEYDLLVDIVICYGWGYLDVVEVLLCVVDRVIYDDMFGLVGVMFVGLIVV